MREGRRGRDTDGGWQRGWKAGGAGIQMRVAKRREDEGQRGKEEGDGRDGLGDQL